MRQTLIALLIVLTATTPRSRQAPEAVHAQRRDRRLQGRRAARLDRAVRSVERRRSDRPQRRKRAFNVYIVSKTTEPRERAGPLVVPNILDQERAEARHRRHPRRQRVQRSDDDPEFLAWTKKAALGSRDRADRLHRRVRAREDGHARQPRSHDVLRRDRAACARRTRR